MGVGRVHAERVAAKLNRCVLVDSYIELVRQGDRAEMAAQSTALSETLVNHGDGYQAELTATKEHRRFREKCTRIIRSRLSRIKCGHKGSLKRPDPQVAKGNAWFDCGQIRHPAESKHALDRHI